MDQITLSANESPPYTPVASSTTAQRFFAEATLKVKKTSKHTQRSARRGSAINLARVRINLTRVAALTVRAPAHHQGGAALCPQLRPSSS